MSASHLGRILVVDDETELLAVLTEKLTQQGYEAVGYAQPREALKLLREQSFDVLLTDLMMPEMDGVALLRAGLEIDPHLAGIIMTGQATVQTAVEALKVGAQDYVLKPFKTSSLLPVLARAFEFRRLRLENVQLRDTVAIYDLCKAISFTSNIQTILHKLADGAVEQCNADEASVMLPSTDGKQLRVTTVLGANRASILGELISIEEGIAGWVARHQEPLLLHGEVHDARFAPLRPRTDIRSAISMPMLVGGRLVGVVNVSVTHGRRQPFTLGQMKALSILASAGAAAIEGALLLTQLREAEARYRSIFENAVEGIVQTTAAGTFLAVNPAMARMLGYDAPDELISRSPEEMCANPADYAEFKKRLEAQGTVQGFEVSFLHKHCQPIWVSLNGRAIKARDGTVTHFEYTAEDITAQRRAEESLRLFRTLLDSSNDAIEVVDPETGRFLDMNETACKSLAYSREELLALGVPDVDPLVAEWTWARCAADIRGSGSKLIESVHRRKD
ncbi:MAG: PAS domain S-box protein, partial [Gemmataceae bacterium]